MKITASIGLFFAITIVSTNCCKFIPRTQTFEKPSSSTMKAAPIGKLIVICGPMACGKTEELMRIIRVLRIAGSRVLVCKHCLDTRVENLLRSRGRPDEKIDAEPIEDPYQILQKFESEPFDCLAFDEIQFASKEMFDVIQTLLERGVLVIVSGLDMDFRTMPFGECMPALLSIADTVIKLPAICKVCHEWNATLTQRLVDGQPARKSDPTVLIDDGSKHNIIYEPRCRRCHELPE